MSRKIRVCSIDGGGIWGYGVARYMMEYEKKTGKKFGSMFDAFAGTSTGAIISAMLSEGYSGTEIYEMYKTEGKKIFKKYPWYKWMWKGVPKYDNSHLQRLLKELLPGNMEDFKKPVFIPVTKTVGNRDKVFDVGDEFPKWKAVLASTSAPTFFKPLDDIYIDGGLWMNNPSSVLIAGLKGMDFFDEDDEIKMVSFATSCYREERGDEVDDMSLLGWAEYMIDNCTGSGEGSTYITRQFLGRENVMRIKPALKDGEGASMDNISKMPMMEKVWLREFDATNTNLKNFMK